MSDHRAELAAECKRLANTFGNAMYWRGAEMATAAAEDRAKAECFGAIDQLASTPPPIQGDEMEARASAAQQVISDSWQEHEMEKDAARYRWLREHFRFLDDAKSEIWFDPAIEVAVHGEPEPEELDRVVGEAMAGAKPAMAERWNRRSALGKPFGYWLEWNNCTFKTFELTADMPWSGENHPDKETPLYTAWQPAVKPSKWGR